MMKKFSFVLAAMFLMVFAVGIASAASTPSCDFTASPETGQEDLIVTFTATYGGITPPVTYSWDFGDGTGAEKLSGSSISHTYSTPGKYTVSLTVNDIGIPTTWWVRNTKTDFITVTNIPPVAGFAYDPHSGNAPLDVAFTSTSTGVIDDLTWDFGDGNTGSGASPVHTYATKGDYTVALTATNDGGSTTHSDTVTVYPPAPVADFGVSSTIGAKPFAVQFEDQTTYDGTITSYYWTFGDGGDSTDPNPLYVYTGAGTYTVTLTVGSISGSDTATGVDYIAVLDEPVECPDIRECPVESIPTTNAGVFRPGSGNWFLDTTFTGVSPFITSFGKTGDIGVVGDWNGNGVDKIGVVRNGNTWILDKSGDGHYNTGDVIYTFGKTGDQYIVGDWNANGVDEIGVIRPGLYGNTWILDYNGNGKYDTGDKAFVFGASPDTMVLGTWLPPI